MGLLSKLFKKASGFSEFEKYYYNLPIWGVVKSQREWRGLDSLILEPMDALALMPITEKREEMGGFNYAYDFWEAKAGLALQLELNFRYRDQVFQIARYVGTEQGKEISLYTYMYAGNLVAAWQKRYDFGHSFTDMVKELNLELRNIKSSKQESILIQENSKGLLWLQVMGNTQVMHIINAPLMEQVTAFVKESRHKSK